MEKEINSNVFKSEIFVDDLWSEMNLNMGLSTSEILKIVKDKILNLSETQSLSDLNNLSKSILVRTRLESIALLTDLENSPINIWELDESNREKLLTRSLSIRCLISGLFFLHVGKRDILEKDMDEENRDKHDLFLRLGDGITHESTYFVNPAMDLLSYCQEEPEAYDINILNAQQKNLVTSLRELVSYLGEGDDVLDLISRTSTLLKESSGKNFDSLSHAIRDHFDSIGVDFDIVEESGLTYTEADGDGSMLYIVVRNIISNALDENIKSGSLENVNVVMTLDEEKKNYLVTCTNGGHFPDSWLNEKGEVIVFGRTTKVTGTGTGLRLIHDYTNKLKGKFYIQNTDTKVVSTLMVPARQ